MKIYKVEFLHIEDNRTTFSKYFSGKDKVIDFVNNYMSERDTRYKTYLEPTEPESLQNDLFFFRFTLESELVELYGVHEALESRGYGYVPHSLEIIKIEN